MDANVRDKPNLLTMTISSFPIASHGSEFLFMIIAFNQMGQISSETSGYILASIPAKPSLAPLMISQSGSSIAIVYNALTTVD